MNNVSPLKAYIILVVIRRPQGTVFGWYSGGYWGRNWEVHFVLFNKQGCFLCLAASYHGSPSARAEVYRAKSVICTRRPGRPAWPARLAGLAGLAGQAGQQIAKH